MTQSQSPEQSAPTEAAPLSPDGQHKHGSIWANPRVASITGAATSVLIHSVLIVLCLLFFYKPLRDSMMNLIVPQEQSIIPIAEFSPTASRGIPNPGLNNDPTHSAGQLIDRSIKDSDGFDDSKSQQLTHALTSGASDASPNAIAIGGNKSGIGKNVGFGTDGGKIARFGPPGGQGLTKGVGMFEKPGGNVHKIVFLVDGTGTMVGLRFDLLRKELKSTISALIPKQQFNIIVYSNADNYSATDSSGLMYATEVNRRKSFDFLDKFAPSGQTNPLPAIEAAFKMKPELIYILSDGEFDNLVNYDEVTKTINKLNADKKVKVNTILFGERDKKAEEVLRNISTQSGGVFTFVTPDMLMKN